MIDNYLCYYLYINNWEKVFLSSVCHTLPSCIRLPPGTAMHYTGSDSDVGARSKTGAVQSASARGVLRFFVSFCVFVVIK